MAATMREVDAQARPGTHDLAAAATGGPRAAKRDEPMPQHDQLDVLDELAAPPADEASAEQRRT
jgi:hypothetical protein